MASEPFDAGEDIGLWFTQEPAFRALMSKAEASTRTDAGDDASVQRWEVETPISFPGMLARSVTPIEISIDALTPRLTITSGQSKTVCEGGPEWARAFLARIADFATTSSSNLVSLRRDAAGGGGGGGARVVSDVSLTVSVQLPDFLPLPISRLEKSGSESLQKLLEKDMAPALAKFTEGYVAWAAAKVS